MCGPWVESAFEYVFEYVDNGSNNIFDEYVSNMISIYYLRCRIIHLHFASLDQSQS